MSASAKVSPDALGSWKKGAESGHIPNPNPAGRDLRSGDGVSARRLHLGALGRPRTIPRTAWIVRQHHICDRLVGDVCAPPRDHIVAHRRRRHRIETHASRRRRQMTSGVRIALGRVLVRHRESVPISEGDFHLRTVGVCGDAKHCHQFTSSAQACCAVCCWLAFHIPPLSSAIRLAQQVEIADMVGKKNHNSAASRSALDHQSIRDALRRWRGMASSAWTKI